MKEEESRRQILTWLARGSVEWYASAEGLGSPPKAVKDATGEYLREADKLQLFIDQHCEVGEGLLTLQAEFAACFRQYSFERISNEELMRRMATKGFKRAKNNDSPRQFYYPRIRCSYTT